VEFDDALLALKRGYRVAREGWNGKGMWLFHVETWTLPGTDSRVLLPFIAMKTADDKIVPWLCSQTDMLAGDWEVVP
jgi:hypothetical protein